ncbi:MAG TPA: sulfotransferase family protein, partial [Candidatus Limnocylindria bacterium]
MNADGAQVSASGTARLILVVGVGRSGTSLLTGILGALGIRIPQPEIQADDTNPRGFGEPRWVVGFHRRLLRELRVTVNDARPTAWDLTGGTGTSGELRDWLIGQLANPGTVAVKDPRTVWFLPLWARTAEGMGVQPRYVTMLRHPAEIVRSAQRHYGNWQTDAGRAAGWLNVMLESERATRGGLRAFARYEDLLADWHTEVQRLGRQVELPDLATAERRPAVDQLVDPSLHRNRARWDGLEVSEPLRALAEQSWELVQRLVHEDGAEVRAELDAARAEYRRLYADAEAIASSSVVAAR